MARGLIELRRAVLGAPLMPEVHVAYGHNPAVVADIGVEVASAAGKAAGCESLPLVVAEEELARRAANGGDTMVSCPPELSSRFTFRSIQKHFFRRLKMPNRGRSRPRSCQCWSPRSLWRATAVGVLSGSTARRRTSTYPKGVGRQEHLALEGR